MSVKRGKSVPHYFVCNHHENDHYFGIESCGCPLIKAIFLFKSNIQIQIVKSFSPKGFNNVKIAEIYKYRHRKNFSLRDNVTAMKQSEKEIHDARTSFSKKLKKETLLEVLSSSPHNK